MKRRSLILLSSMIFSAISLSDCAIVSQLLSRCRGSTLRESEPDISGTLTYSLNGRFFCRWILQQVQDPGEVIVLHVKEISFPNCKAKITLPGSTAACVREWPFCHAYISDDSYCDTTDIQQQAEAMYADCNETTVTSGLQASYIDFSPTTRNRKKFTIEFAKMTCNNQTTTARTTSVLYTTETSVDTTANSIRNNLTTMNPTAPTKPQDEVTTDAASSVTNENRTIGVKIMSPMSYGATESGLTVNTNTGTPKARILVEVTTGADTVPQKGGTDGGEVADSNPGMIAALIVIPIGLTILAIILLILLPRKKQYNPGNPPNGDDDAVKYQSPQDESKI